MNEGGLKLRVGNGAFVAVQARGRARLKFGNKFLILKDVFFIPDFSRNLISVSMLQLERFVMTFTSFNISISFNGSQLCIACLENGLYILRPNEPLALNNDLFKVAKPRTNKRQKTDNNNMTYLWHLRLGHIGYDRIQRLTKDGPLRELTLGELPVCESCLEGKLTKRPFSAKGDRAKEPLGLVHSDVCGPLNVQARGVFEYFVTFIDDYSRYSCLYLMHRKSETFSKFQEFLAMAQNQLGKTLKILRSDRGGEYLDMQFQDHLTELGILSQLTALLRNKMV